MQYYNPIVTGFYPDPSVCYANGKFYMVNSSFQFFPGVPLWESEDLLNWKPIGHVLTRKSQVELDKVNTSGGVFAPTIRYNDGRFYMVTTNDTTHKNFFVYTDDIYSEWSEPVEVDQDGIDPSLFFENGICYFMSNGTDEDGDHGVVQCIIDPVTGEKKCRSKCIWHGTGGRYLESPHLYKIGGYYYVMAAEGGTEYGHMITYGRGTDPFGPFENYAKNPVLTNRNKAPYIIQGIGHGDLIRKESGEWFILSLGFRQYHIWTTHHQLGREVFLTPVTFDADGWFTSGNNGTTDDVHEMQGALVQNRPTHFEMSNESLKTDWIYLRHPHFEDYELSGGKAILHGTRISLNETDSPTFVGIRQREFNGTLTANVTLDNGEAGITAYMDETEHYEVAIRKIGDTETLADRSVGYVPIEGAEYEAVCRLNIGGIRHLAGRIALSKPEAVLKVKSDNWGYTFSVIADGAEHVLGNGMAKFLSSETCGGFTGVVFGLYAYGTENGKNTAAFSEITYDITLQTENRGL